MTSTSTAPTTMKTTDADDGRDDVWGVRRRDAARHSESGWLIRPEMRSSTSFGIFLSTLSFLFLLSLITLSLRKLSYRLGLNDIPLSRPADPSGPVRAHFWAMALVMHLMTLFIAPA